MQIQLQHDTKVKFLPVFHFYYDVDMFSRNTSLYLDIVSFSLDEVICILLYVS